MYGNECFSFVIGWIVVISSLYGLLNFMIYYVAFLTAVLQVILLAQQKASEVDGALANKRTQFMLETLKDLKNNKRKMAVESIQVQTLQKTTKAIVAKQPGSKGALQVSMDDLLNAETRGRWWRVGAAWAGFAAKPYVVC